MKTINNIFSAFFFGASFVGTLACNAQFLHDNNNRPLTEKRYEDVSGSTYFNDSFLKGKVRLTDKKEYDNLLLKYDQVKEQLLFKNNKDDEFPSEFTIPVTDFKLVLPDGNEVTFENINPTDDSKGGLYQVIFKGKVALYKRTKKNIVQNASYNTANTEKRVTISTTYLIRTEESKLLNVRPDKKAFLNVLSDKSKEIEQFIISEKINFKRDQDLEKLMNYYNSLL
jgi:hypothetical protein